MRFRWTRTLLILAAAGLAVRLAAALLFDDQPWKPGGGGAALLAAVLLTAPVAAIADLIAAWRERRGYFTPPDVAARRWGRTWRVALAALPVAVAISLLLWPRPGERPHGLYLAFGVALLAIALAAALALILGPIKERQLRRLALELAGAPRLRPRPAARSRTAV